MIAAQPLLAGVELGGAECVSTLGTGPQDIRLRLSIPSGCDPEMTIMSIAKPGWSDAASATVNLHRFAGPLGASALAADAA